MKKILATALAASLGISSVVSFTSCSQGKTVSEEDIKAFGETITASEIVGRIDSIGEATKENEQSIEQIFIDYTELSDEDKLKVSNYDKLDAARNAITKLYHTEEKEGPRFDRSQIQIGTYCVYNTSEERLQWLKDAGITFVAGAPYNMDVLDLFSKYGIGAFISYLPGWYGGDGSNSGGYSSAVPSGTFDSYAAEFVDHPAIWAVDVGDEPSSADFPHFGIMINEAKKLFPDQLVYLNVYPLEASADQQGCEKYEDYVKAYVDNIDTDYLSFDFYDIRKLELQESIGTRTSEYYMLRHVENLRIVANACKEKGIDMYTVMQAGAYSYKDRDYVTVKQLNSQLYTALAFGSQLINWACWESGWFDPNTNMIDSTGERTPAYYNVQEVNANIKALSPVYMRYRNTDTAFVGNPDAIIQPNVYFGEDSLNFLKKDGNVFEQEMFQNIKVSSDTSKILAGAFVKRDGEGDAILFSNVTEFFGEDELTENNFTEETVISFTLKDPERKVVIYYPEMAYVLKPDKDGVYSFHVANTDGVFITAEPVASVNEEE